MSLVPLLELAEINPPAPKLAAKERVSFLPMADASDDGTVNALAVRAYEDVKTGYTGFRNDDLLLAKVTPCFENNKIVQAKLPHAFGFGSTEFHVVRPRDDVDGRYLLHFLRQDWVRHEGERRMTGSGGQRRVPKTFLEQLRLPKPPLPEQRRIAAILDQADALRRLRRQSLTRLADLGQAIFEEMFGDPKNALTNLPRVSFAEACSDQTSKFDKVQAGDFQQSGDVAVVDQGKSRIAGWVSDARKVCDLGHPVVVFGDHTRAVKYIDFPFIVGADGAKVLVPSPAFSPRFFAELLRLLPLLDLGYSRHMRELKQMSFPCPTRAQQDLYTQRMQSVDDETGRHNIALSALDSLFTSLQHRAFNGEL